MPTSIGQFEFVNAGPLSDQAIDALAALLLGLAELDEEETAVSPNGPRLAAKTTIGPCKETA